MIQNARCIVAKHDLPSRLDAFLRSRFPHVPRLRIVQAIESHDILVNGSASLKGTTLKAGDVVLVRQLFEESDIRVIPNDKIKFDVIHEDDEIIVINKPAGIPVHPIRPHETDTLANGLIARYPGLAGVGGDPLFPAFVHRLDTDTSGIIVAAKNDEAYRKLRKQFKDKNVQKIYFALVHGNVAKGGKIDNYLIHDPKDDRKMQVVKSPFIKGDTEGCHSCGSRDSGRYQEGALDFRLRGNDKKPPRYLRAITLYKPLKRFGPHTLLEVEIKTGVMHQIRCHMAGIGHPVVGDKIYGGQGTGGRREEARGKVHRRHLLHAAKIGFVHPATGKQVRFEANPPDDFRQYILQASCASREANKQ